MAGSMRGMILSLSASLLAVAGVRGEDAVEGDLKTLQGVWTVESMGGGEITYTFKGRILKLEAPSRSYTMTVTLDPKAKPDKTIDFKIDEGPADAEGQTSKGIYRFDGQDKFVFCFRPQGERPTVFEQVGFEQFLTELKRKDAKPAPEKAKEAPKPADGDAPLPEKWPAATEPGKIEVKSYPVYRSAIIRGKDLAASESDRMFFPLFAHITAKGIEMTAPVVMTYEPKVIERLGEKGEVSMEFLYRRPDQGQAGPGLGQVKVEDRPASSFVCLGVQGAMEPERTREGVARLRTWLSEHKDEWVADGPPRLLGYHGPQTPVARQLWEVQVPVRAVRIPAEKPSRS